MEDRILGFERRYNQTSRPFNWRFTRNDLEERLRELMTPSGTGALSAITVQSLDDIGYGVDVTQADKYTLPGAAATVSADGDT